MEKIDEMKRTDRGGADAIKPNKYLNIWVYKLPKNTSGFATFPYAKAGSWSDGAVISTNCFGTIGRLKNTQQKAKQRCMK